MDNLGTIQESGLTEPISSNGLPICARCDKEVTPENDSGWEVFISGGTTQPTCVECNNKELQQNWINTHENSDKTTIT